MRPRTELDLPIALDRSAAVQLHAQLAAALRSAVLDGLVAPDSRLPPTRLLAAALGVSRSTALKAYERLEGEGYLDARHGSGTYVREHVPPGPPAAVRSHTTDGAAAEDAPVGEVLLDLRPGRPDTGRLADAAWHAAWRDAARHAPPPHEPPPRGLLRLREQITAHLRAARGLAFDPADLFITAGTADGLALLVHALGPSPRPVAVENPGYPGARQLLTRLGCSLQPVEVDSDGLVVENLSALPVPPRMVLVTPSHQYPLGGCLPITRRRALLEWAERVDAIVVEDDYDSEFRFGAAPLPALAGLDACQRVVHLGTFSKVLSPWLRIGYLHVPPRLQPAVLATRIDLGTAVSGITQQAVARYLANGDLGRHIARARRDYTHRRKHLTRLVSAEPRLRLRGSRAGLHAVIELPEQTDVAALLHLCQQQGILLEDLSMYDASPLSRTIPAVVIGYSSATLADLDQGITALAAALRD